ncbi:MAG TPA: DUF4253 domain-containing protein [Anaeromyxobacter sp.]
MRTPISAPKPLWNLRAPATLVAALALAAAPLAAGASDPIALGKPKTFDDAVAALERATGAKGEPVELGGKPVPPGEGRAFPVDGATAERLLSGSHASFRTAGLYLFRLERSFGIAGEKDPVVLLKTADRDAVVRRVGTSSAKTGATTESIVAWLDALAKDEPFELTEVGVDYLAGRFARAPKDPEAVARRCVAIAPDLVAARASTFGLLVEEIRSTHTLYLIF